MGCADSRLSRGIKFAGEGLDEARRGRGSRFAGLSLGSRQRPWTVVLRDMIRDVNSRQPGWF